MKKYTIFIIIVWFFSNNINAYTSQPLVEIEVTCTAPTTQPTNLTFTNTFCDYSFASFTATSADGYLTIISTSATLTTLPINGSSYEIGNIFGNAKIIGDSAASSVPIYWLNPNTTYYVFVFSYNNIGCGTNKQYNTNVPLVNSFTTQFASSQQPLFQPTNLVFSQPSSTTISGSFTSSGNYSYLVIQSESSILNAAPVERCVYTIGSKIGNGTVISSSISNSFTSNGLIPNKPYYFYIFSYTNLSCNCGTLYKTELPLIGTNSILTTPCNAPTTQPTSLVFSTPTATSVSGSFSPATANNYLIVYSLSSTLSAMPVNGTVYTSGSSIGNSTVLSVGNSTSFNATGLTLGATYYFTVFSLNDFACSNGPQYNTALPLKSSITITTPCTAPTSQPTSLVFSTPTATSVSGSFSPATANNYLIVYSLSSTLSAMPVNGTVYTSGSSIGNSTVLSVSNSTNFNATGLTLGSTYYFTIFSLNDFACSNGPQYNATSPLKSSLTLSSTTLNYYFGNFHSHSEYSDGTGLPSGNFAYADAANCMDFLGISEHNHVAAGMALSNWSLGRAQAVAARTPTFLALYGMEWGVISGGGHVIVYGVPNLLGWDAGQYDTFVAKNDYTGTAGLFKTINNFGGNAFATLAHPNNSDFNGIMSLYNSEADNAIVGSAVENGPSTSTNTTYSDPPTSMSDLPFYRNMLARGYHLGPTIDHDNHNVTHGRTTLGRTVVLASSLTESEILGAMRNMRFYASEDCSAIVNYKINNNTLGSTLTNAGAPNITVTTTTSSPVTSLKIYSGVSGSGTNATVLTSTTSGTINYTHSTLANGSSLYYYIDITESDGKRIITAPIWYTRNDTP